MLICDGCIMAIRSRGEKIYVGDTVYMEDEELTCNWCDEPFDELFKVRLD